MLGIPTADLSADNIVWDGESFRLIDFDDDPMAFALDGVRGASLNMDEVAESALKIWTS